MGTSAARSPQTALPPAGLAVFAMIAGRRDRLHLSEFDGRVSGQCWWVWLFRPSRRVDGYVNRPLSAYRLRRSLDSIISPSLIVGLVNIHFGYWGAPRFVHAYM